MDVTSFKNPFKKSTSPNCWAGHDYAEKVCSEEIPVSKYTRGACERYLRDIQNKKADFYFDEEKAERYLKMVQQFEHPIGVWKTKNIIYEPWQCWVWMNIMGFVSRRTGFRRFRVAHVELPRGQAKSTMASQCVLFMLALDNPSGNQIATVATKRDQAKIVLDSARAMAMKAHSYRSKTGVQVLAHSIVHKESNSIARAMSSDHKGLDGLNDVLAVCDELHAMRRDTFDVIMSGMSKRTDSLLLCITTAGFDIESVGYSQSQYAKKVCLGEMQDDQMFCVIYTADDGDDILSEITWKKANPGWGTSVDPVTFEAKAKKASVTPADLPNFKVKHLNMWLSEGKAFFDTQKWEALGDPELRLEDFRGKPCILGVDIASHIDLTSLGFIFPVDDKLFIFDKSFIPEETVKATRGRNSIYENCVGSGHLIQTPGEVVKQEFLEKEVVEATRMFKVHDILVDPWNAIALLQKLQAANLPVTEFRMNVQNLSEPTKTLDSMIREGSIRHNSSPLLRWCLGNVVCKIDANDNVYPRKSNEKLKIDPIIAILMALASHLQNVKKVQIYSTRGLRFL